MRIGITEQGDAGLDFSWFGKLRNNHYDGAILITKNANPKFINKVLDLYEGGFKNLILHIGCTGWGGTVIEPNVPDYTVQLQAIQTLIQSRFPASQIVLRIDPIIPTDDGLVKTKIVLNEFAAMNTPIKRIRISLLDEYKHVKQRLIDNGLPTFYNGFYADRHMQANVANLLGFFPQFQFETCAEDYFVQYANLPNLHAQGCISMEELKLFGISANQQMLENMQNRNMCHCLSCKTELLQNKKRCPHQCIYCYWRD